MPIVPTRQPSEVTTRVGSTPVQNTGVSDLASGLAQAGSAAGGIGLDIQMRENADRVMQAELALRDAEREHRNEVESRKGVDAFGVTKESEQWWADKTQEVANSLTNGAQKQMFNEVAANRRQVSLDTISGYEAAERRTSFNQSSEATIADAINAAAEQSYNIDAIELEKQRIIGTVRDMGESNGWTKEMIDRALEDNISTMHGAVIDSLMADSPPAAEEYFKAHRKEIAGTARSTIDAMITARMIKHKAHGMVASWYGHEDDYSDALKKVNKIKDPDLKKAARDELTLRHGDAKGLRQERETKAVREVWDRLAAGGTTSKIPPQLWVDVPGTDRIQMEAWEQQVAQNKIKDRTVDELTVLTTAEQLIEQNQIRDLEGLQPYLPFLQETSRERLRQAMLENTTVPLEDLRKAYEARAGKKRDVVGVNAWGKDEWEEWKLLQDYVRRRVKAGAQAKDVHFLVDEFYMEGKSKKTFFFQNDPDTVKEALEMGRTDFVIDAPVEFKPVLQAVADELGTTADELYTKGGRDAINMLVKADKPVTAANIKYVLEQLNAN